MREYGIPLGKELLVGLRKKVENRRNSAGLTESAGVYPENESLRSLDVLTRLDTSVVSASFPYPQIFVLRQVVIICSETEVWEYSVENDTLVLAASGLEAGVTWSVADFGDYVLMVNGAAVLQRMGDTKSWTQVNEFGVPVATSVANVNGQVVFTAPDAVVPDADI